MKKVYYCSYNDRNNTCWLLTTNEEYASQIDPNYGLATLDDLYDWAAATGVIYNECIISIFEGNVKWKVKKIINHVGDLAYHEEYEFVD